MNSEKVYEVLDSYESISLFIKNTSVDEIALEISEALSCSVETLLAHPMGGYSKGHTSGAYGVVLFDLKNNISYYDWLYNRLYDEISREVFTNLIRFRICPDMNFIKAAYDGENPQYFDKSIVSCDENEVFVDCGGYIGDTVMSYMEEYGVYKKIIVYEPDEENIVKCHENTDKYPNIDIRPAGVGEKSTHLALFGGDSSGSFMGAAESEANDAGGIKIISLDEDIRETVTFIKMDIEGFEIPAILGAKRHIKYDKPKLAICLYHVVSDIWEIPKLVDYINPEYRFYIRHYWEDQNWETVLYAIPEKQSQKTLVAMASEERPWNNAELVKDCGLLPYLFHKNHGYRSVMVGEKGEDYSNLSMVPGLELDFIPDSSEESKIRYIEEHAKEIDVLMVRGVYSRNFALTKKYKELNPKGKAYLGPDGNSEWMDRIVWTDSDFSDFMNCFDLIGVSCSGLANYLNKKWPWEVECFPNGFYDFCDGKVEQVPFGKKENTILTVARIGTAQKANHVMLSAFAKIAGEIPDWKLKLVGNVEEGFKSWLEKYYETFPALKDRVVIAGPIFDRISLMNEYEKAKIFALSSVVEGAPNVAAEALHSGNVIVTTDVDAASDMTGDGRCGSTCPVGDVDGFAEILLKECTSKDLENRSARARVYSEEFYDMEKIARSIYERLGL